MVFKVDVGGLYKYCYLFISFCYLSNLIYKVNILLEVIMLKIYCCYRKDF